MTSINYLRITPEWPINRPLFTLDILGSEDGERILRANKTEIVGRGSLDYILSMRKRMLENRGFHIPQDYQTSWNADGSEDLWTLEDYNEEYTNVAAWWKFDGLDLADGATISSHNDSSGNGINLTGSNVTYSTNAINGLGAASLNVSNAVFTAADSDALDMEDNPVEFYMVWKRGSDLTSNNRYFLWKTSSTDATLRWGWHTFRMAGKSGNPDTVKYYLRRGGSKFSADVVGPGYWTVGDSYLSSAVVSSADETIDFYVTGNEISGSTGDHESDVDNDGVLYVGNYQTATAAMAGHLGEMIMITHEFGPDDGQPQMVNSLRTKIEGYLAHKWGLTSDLPADHAYKSSPPIRD